METEAEARGTHWHLQKFALLPLFPLIFPLIYLALWPLPNSAQSVCSCNWHLIGALRHVGNTHTHSQLDSQIDRERETDRQAVDDVSKQAGHATAARNRCKVLQHFWRHFCKCIANSVQFDSKFCGKLPWQWHVAIATFLELLQLNSCSL